MILLFKMTPKHSAEVLSFPKLKKALCALWRKISVLDKLHPGMSLMPLAMSSMLMNQQYTLNKVSLNRNTHKTRLRYSSLMKML